MITVFDSPELIRVSGHAGYAEPGHDIVCAGASTLVMTLIRSMPQLSGGSPPYTLKDGDFTIKLKHLSHDQRVLIDAFLIGIDILADSAPEYVQRVKTE